MQINHYSKIVNKVVAGAYLDGLRIGQASMILDDKPTAKTAALIEDVIVDKEHRKQGVGKQLIGYLLEYAQCERCYKAVLQCNDDNVEFYEKCGFHKHENGMRIDLEE